MKIRDYSHLHKHAGVEHRFTVRRKPSKIVGYIVPTVVLLIIAGAIYFLLFSSFFDVKRIAVKGTTDSNIITEVENRVMEYLEINTRNVYRIDVGKVESAVKSVEGVENVKIVKRVPSSMDIELSEQVPLLLWSEKDELFLVNSEGVVDTQVLASQLKWDLPTVSAATTTKVMVGKSIVKPEIGSYMSKVYSNLGILGEKINYYKFEVDLNNQDEVKIISHDGYYVLLSIDSDVDVVKSDLEDLMNEKFREKKPTEYIDLRLDGKVFYR